MLPHEEFLQKALEECMISQLVRDLGNVYLMLVNRSGSEADFVVALQVAAILSEASNKIADLGPKPKIPHPMDTG